MQRWLLEEIKKKKLSDNVGGKKEITLKSRFLFLVGPNFS